MQFVKPKPFQEAVRMLGGKSVIGSQLKSSEWQEIPLALRERAFFSATIESVRFLQNAKDFVSDFLTGARVEIPKPTKKDPNRTVSALKAGGRSQFVKEMREFAIANGLGPLDPNDKGTIKDITSEARLSLLFNTLTQSAHDYGWFKQGMDEDVLNEFPAQRFIREADVKITRPLHAQNEGVVRLKTDLDFWLAMNSPLLGGFGVPWGPWGFNSGMGVEDVDRDEAESLGLIQPSEKVQSVDNEFNERLGASVRNLDPELTAKLQSQFGDQVKIEDGIAWWKKVPAKIGQLPVSSPVPVKPSEPDRTAPVSDSVTISTTRAAQSSVEHALNQIDLVHDDGKLSPLTINHRIARGSQGTYYRGGKNIGIRRTQAAHREMTVAHEIGHWIDEIALPGSWFSSEASSDLAGWRKAVENSQAFQNLKTKQGYLNNPRYQKYQTSWRELWARSYAQFIAEKSGDKIMMEQLNAVREGRSGGYWMDSQWTSEDFKPIAEEIEKVFKKLGWL